MSSFGQVPIKDVWDMLTQCAPGHTVQEFTHSFCIRFNEQTYPTFPKKRLVDKGHVKKMARHIGVLDCAREVLSL